MVNETKALFDTFCRTWFDKLIVNTWSRFAYYPACKALRETSMFVRVSVDGQVFTVEFEKPNLLFIPSSDVRYNAVNKLFPRFIYEGYNPDVLGLYLPQRVKVDDIILDNGIYLYVGKIIEYWRQVLSRRVFFNVNTLLALVFYHEYFHMVMDKLGISNFYRDDGEFRIGDKTLKYKDYEEVLTELYALTNTLFYQLLFRGISPELGQCVCDPMRHVKIEITGKTKEDKVMIVDENVSYQPVSWIRFIELERPYPYNMVRKLWNDYLFTELLKRNFYVLAIMADQEDPDYMYVRRLLAKLDLDIIKNPKKYLYEKIYNLFIDTIDKDVVRENAIIDVNVYLLGVDHKQLSNIGFSCNDLL